MPLTDIYPYSSTSTFSETLVTWNPLIGASRTVTEAPFGTIISQSGDAADDNPFRFSTKYHEAADVGTSGDTPRLVYYGYRFYDPEFGGWVSRDPLGDEASFTLELSRESPSRRAELRKQAHMPAYQLLGNDPIDRTDYLGLSWSHVVTKQRGGQIGQARGLTGGATIIADARPLFDLLRSTSAGSALMNRLGQARLSSTFGLVAGQNISVMFFPDSCEIAAYSATAGILDGDFWRPLAADDFVGHEFHGGVFAAIGGGSEVAWFRGGSGAGDADAISFAGVFTTGEAAASLLGVSGYRGVHNEGEPFWYGGTITAGAGIGGGVIDWNYELLGAPVDLNEIALGRCLCRLLILGL